MDRWPAKRTVSLTRLTLNIHISSPIERPFHGVKFLRWSPCSADRRNFLLHRRNHRDSVPPDDSKLDFAEYPDIPRFYRCVRFREVHASSVQCLKLLWPPVKFG